MVLGYYKNPIFYTTVMWRKIVSELLYDYLSTGSDDLVIDNNRFLNKIFESVIGKTRYFVNLYFLKYHVKYGRHHENGLYTEKKLLS